MGTHGWIGVDLDGTLAHYAGWNAGAIGHPIERMVDRVKQWLADGVEVRIVTARVARASCRDDVERLEQVRRIEAWCVEHLGQQLPVTSEKDFMMIELWDDRCVQLQPNTGIALQDLHTAAQTALMAALERLESVPA
jgi:hypothetical protein